MKILITGGGGFLGSGMVEMLAGGGHALRIMEPELIDTPHECFAGDVSMLDDVRRAMDGVDGVVICHMAPRDPDAYETPELCFKINVTGTANLFHVAMEMGIKKIVVISSTGRKPADPEAWCRTIPFEGMGLYGITKECQEVIGLNYAREHGMHVALLRVGYILDGETMQDKYGNVIEERNALDADRRDIGEVARLCLEQEHEGLQVFPVMSTPESQKQWGVQHTIDTLGWTPRYDFNHLPRDGEE